MLEDVQARGGLQQAQILAAVTQRLFGGPRHVARLGRYELRETIGQGAFSVVWAAHDPDLDRDVAIKIVKHEPYEVDASITEARLRREAQTLARLDHPNVVKVFDVGAVEGPDGVDGWFVVMERVVGIDLAAWNAASPRRRVDEVLRVFIAAARGLAAVHAAGLVHRDIKPANVLISDDGEVKLADFGLARGPGGGIGPPEHGNCDPRPPGDSPRLTADRAIVGTPVYMAPEQHRGEPADALADQYAFCVALFEALLGHPPFSGKTSMMLAEAKSRTPIIPAGLPAWLARTLARGLSPEPAQRWPDMHALILHLERKRGARRSLVVAALAVPAVAALFAIAASPAPCTAITADGVPGFGPALREEVAASLASADPEGTTTRTTMQRLDGHARDWLAARVQVCERGVAASATPEVLALQQECLRRNADDLHALGAALVDADARVAERASEAAGSLRSPAECLDATEPAAGDVPSPAASQRVADVRAELSAAAAKTRLGRIDAALGHARAAHAASVALDDAPLLAQAEASLGTALADAGALLEAEAMLETAYLRARECGSDRVAMETAQTLAFVVGVRQARYDDGDAWLRHARASWERGGRPTDEASILAGEGAIAVERGALREAETKIGTALELASSGDAPPLRIAALHGNHGFVLAKLGDLERARAAHGRAMAIRVAEQGQEHPAVARIHYNLGTLEMRAGRLDEARVRLERAHAIRERTLGPRHIETVVVTASLADLAHRRGEADRAHALYASILPIYEAAYGPGHKYVGELRLNLGEAARELGDLEGARAQLDRSVEILSAALGPDHAAVANPLTALGAVLLAQGRRDDAIAVLDRALATRQRSDPWQRRAETESLLAQALAARGRPTP